MASGAWRLRPSCSPFPAGISPSPSRGGPGWGWVSVGLGGNPSPPNPPLEGEGFKAGFVEGDGSDPGNRILPCKSSPLRYANSPRPLRETSVSSAAVSASLTYESTRITDRKSHLLNTH